LGDLVFIIGGGKSGKSSLAVELARKYSPGVLFVATALSLDEEMRLKIEKHRKSRPKSWQTIEVKKDLLTEVQSERSSAKALILDCLTLYLAQRIEKPDFSEEVFFKEIESFISWAKKGFELSLIVSNEVGSGVVPATGIGRIFSEVLGRANQLVASFSDRVYFLVSGIPLLVKQKGDESF